MTEQNEMTRRMQIANKMFELGIWTVKESLDFIRMLLTPEVLAAQEKVITRVSAEIGAGK